MSNRPVETPERRAASIPVAPTANPIAIDSSDERAYEAVARLAPEIPWDSTLPAWAFRWPWRFRQRVKRGLDCVAAALGLVVLSPLLLLVALAVVLDAPGPVFYPWRVLGHRARPFTGYKFRTMVPNADRLKRDLLQLNEMTGPVFKMREDPRVTRVGRFLRRYSLDELPQLWSVLVGDMSLVGPRPPSPAEFLAFEPAHRLKLAVRPGITCLWQVSGRSEIANFAEWVRLDLEYIGRWSLRLDLAILARTLPAVFTRRGAY